MSVRVLVADDHTVVLDGLRALFAMEPDLEVVATCTDGEEAVEAAESLDPDVLVLDAAMPRRAGITAHEELRRRGVAIPTVILSATLSDEAVLRCLSSAVEGIVLKDAAAGDLIDAVRTVARGERWFPPGLAARAAEALASGTGSEEAEGDLTPREREVVMAVAAGKSNKRVASELGVSISTVKQHLHKAFAKLGVTNRVQLSLMARERGWI